MIDYPALSFFGLLTYEKIEQSMAPRIIKDFWKDEGMPIAQVQFTKSLVGEPLAEVEALFEGAGSKCDADISKLDYGHLASGDFVCRFDYKVEANLTVDRRIKDIRAERWSTCL